MDSLHYVDELGRRESGIFGINRGAGDSKVLGRFVNRYIDQHNHFMRKKDSKVAPNENDQLIAIEHFELSPIHLPGGLLASGIKTGLFFLPHQKGFRQNLHGHHHIDLHKDSLPRLLERILQMPVLFRKSKDPVPLATLHKIWRNRIYSGDFDWKEKTYRGNYQPLVTRDLWNRVQEVMDPRFFKHHRKFRHDFAFSGLIFCGHCDCSLIGEIKKDRYVYYHCTGYKGKCPEPCTREEVLEEKFTDVLRALSFDGQVLAWVTKALRESHEDEKHYHDEAVTRLQKEYERLQDRIDVMYVDKLDGRVNAAFFDKKATEWREEQNRILRRIEEHQSANEPYMMVS